jgi:hypothetical protein
VVTVVGNVDGEGFVDSYVSALESAGFEERSTFSVDGTINNVYSNDEWTVARDVLRRSEREPGHRLGVQQQLTTLRSPADQRRQRPHGGDQADPCVHRAAHDRRRSRLVSSSCFAGGLTIASALPTNSAPPNASTSQARRSSPRNMPTGCRLVCSFGATRRSAR